MTKEKNELFFDNSYFSSTPWQKAIRSLQLGFTYYFKNIPRYMFNRKKLGLRFWDVGALTNPFLEFKKPAKVNLPLPPKYEDCIQQLHGVGLHSVMPRKRLEAIIKVWWSTKHIPGDVMECGSYQGTTSLLLALLGKENGLEQTVFTLDTFEGVPETSIFDGVHTGAKFNDSIRVDERIRAMSHKLNLGDRIEVHKGLFEDTFCELRKRPLKFSFVHIDANLYEGTRDACKFTVPRLSSGGGIVFDDYNSVCDLGARLAIDQVMQEAGFAPQPLTWTSAYIRTPEY